MVQGVMVDTQTGQKIEQALAIVHAAFIALWMDSIMGHLDLDL